ncbi:MAG TPA: 16S rRNA (guanine(527)-N(7))-methyltransferase RsmG [Pseudobdellovibrionaceae bacterium]|nr:16S rRNA (guanine(527)-N(7))-methyltransferase RsmG [Pseudobdellovibrionaceae bacterium]
MNTPRHKKPDHIYPLEEANDRLLDIFKNHGFDIVSHSERRQLAHFYQLLMENQRENNFTRLIQFKDIAIKHFIDSLIILNYTSLQFPLLDVGTGPGFPGIPLKIKFPDEKIILAEGVQKRVNFLKKVRETLELKNLEIIGRHVDSTFLYPARGVITRAVEDLGETLGHVQNALGPGSKVYFMKGPNVDEELKKAQKDFKKIYSLKENISYTLPKTTHHRRLIIFEKN